MVSASLFIAYTWLSHDDNLQYVHHKISMHVCAHNTHHTPHTHTHVAVAVACIIFTLPMAMVHAYPTSSVLFVVTNKILGVWLDLVTVSSFLCIILSEFTVQ